MTAKAALRDELRRLAAAADADVDLAEAALTLAALARPSLARGRYRDFLAAAAAALGEQAGPEPGLEARVAALAEVIAGRYGFAGDDRDRDDMANADLARVIDLRRGLPVALGLLYLHLARSVGWRIDALAFPAHFLVRLETDDGRRAIIDPFAGGARLEAAALRDMLKAFSGAAAELAPRHYAAIGNRDVLMRLQNTIKVRMLRDGSIERALAVVESMLLFAPDRIALWREAGMMHLHLGDLNGAIPVLEQFVARAPESTARHRMSVLVQELRGRPR